MKKDKKEGKMVPIPVPIGDGIEVRPHSKVGLKFAHIGKEGTASAAPTLTYPPHPKGKFLSDVFEISTTAVFSGKVKVAISFDGQGLTEDNKKALRVYKHDLKKDSKWEDVTSSIDTKKDIAYGEIDHFSVFGVK